MKAKTQWQKDGEKQPEAVREAAKRLLGHEYLNLVHRRYGIEPVAKAVRGYDVNMITQYLVYADSLLPGVRRMIINGEWVDVRTDHLGEGMPQEEWEAYVDTGDPRQQ